MVHVKERLLAREQEITGQWLTEERMRNGHQFSKRVGSISGGSIHEPCSAETCLLEGAHPPSHDLLPEVSQHFDEAGARMVCLE